VNITENTFETYLKFKCHDITEILLKVALNTKTQLKI
jgi:hypothetical protein